MKKKWLKISDAATVLKVSERTLYTRIKSGNLKSKLEGGKRFIQVKMPNESSAAKSEISDENFENPAANPEMFETVEHLLVEKDARIQQQEGHIKQLEGQVDNLTQQIDHLTQVVAMSQKNIGALTEQLDDSRQLIEDMRQRRTVWQRLKTVFVAETV